MWAQHLGVQMWWGLNHCPCLCWWHDNCSQAFGVSTEGDLWSQRAFQASWLGSNIISARSWDSTWSVKLNPHSQSVPVYSQYFGMGWHVWLKPCNNFTWSTCQAFNLYVTINTRRMGQDEDCTVLKGAECPWRCDMLHTPHYTKHSVIVVQREVCYTRLQHFVLYVSSSGCNEYDLYKECIVVSL